MRQEAIYYKFPQPWKVKIRKYKFSDFFYYSVDSGYNKLSTQRLCKQVIYVYNINLLMCEALRAAS